jgi:pyruvyltransferase
VARVELVHWNPRKKVFKGPAGRYLRFSKPVNNFGDLLGPYIVREILRRRELDARSASIDARLLSIGSIMHHSRNGDTVWGTGVNGKTLDVPFTVRELDVRAVRGPLTQKYLAGHGIQAPSIFGDPGLLLGALFGRERFARNATARDVLVIPNLNDYEKSDDHDGSTISPQSELSRCLEAIASSTFVTGSSLHAIIVAEAFGIPARLIQSESEPDFKYRDYYLGSGRGGYEPARNVAEAVRMGGEPPIQWDHRPLLGAFPEDLWRDRLSRD